MKSQHANSTPASKPLLPQARRDPIQGPIDAPIALLEYGDYAGCVREDFRSGERGGVNGTPTFVVNGVRYDGELEVNALVTALAEPNTR